MLPFVINYGIVLSVLEIYPTSKITKQEDHVSCHSINVDIATIIIFSSVRIHNSKTISGDHMTQKVLSNPFPDYTIACRVNVCTNASLYKWLDYDYNHLDARKAIIMCEAL